MREPVSTNPDTHVLQQLLVILRRRWLSLVLFILAGVVLAGAYAASIVPQYASSATVMVRSGFAADPVRPGVATSTPEEEGLFLSQLEMAKSASVASMVAMRLDLENDADFARAGSSSLQQVLQRIERLAGVRTGLIRQPAAATLDRDAVVARLRAGIRALRAGRTYVAAMSYTHPNPEVARNVAQAFAEAFRQKLAEASDLANSRARATIEAELAKASPEARPLLEQKYQDMVITRALPGVDAVIISDAQRPGAPIAPRTSFLLAVGAIVGAAVGCLFAGWREMRDTGVRDGDSLARQLGLRFIGYLPRMAVDGTQGTSGDGRFVMPQGGRLAIDQQFSRFGETVRAAAVNAAAVPETSGQVIAVTSILPGEGKTAFAANLASHIGNQGRKVLLIDADLRHQGLSEWLAPGARKGIVDVLLQATPAAEAGLFESRSNITFVPAALDGRSVDPAGLLSGDHMKALLAEQRQQHDVVILDLPSMTTAADTRAIAPLVDSFVLLAEWGLPSPELIRTMLEGEPEIAAKIAGVVISRTDMRKLPLYATSASRGAYLKRIG